MPSCGKTTLGKVIANRLNMPFVDFDEEIEQAEKMTIPQLFQSKGEEYFRQKESQITQYFGKENGRVLSVGGGTPTTKENRDSLKRNGIIFYVQRDLDKLITSGRPLSQKEGVNALFEKRDAHYRVACDYVVENNATIDAAAEEIIKRYEENFSN